MAFSLVRSQGAAFWISDLLHATHGFSTRLGGVSDLPHTAGLNLAFGRGDEAAVVLENLSRFALAVGVDPAAVVSVPQVHGNRVHRVDHRHRGMGYVLEAGFTGDGYVTADPTVAVGVKTADCTPILLEAEVAGRVVAVSALHAGWKGTVADIAGEGVGHLTELACEVSGVAASEVTIRAAIGPCIHAECFEVKEDCLAAVRGAWGEDAEAWILRRDGGFYLDLPAMNRALLLRAGVREENLDVCGLCTMCHPELFYSHRGSGGVRGTMLNLITPVARGQNA